MYKTDFPDFQKTIDRCADAFSKPRPNDEILQTYWRALQDQSIESVRQCADKHIRYGKFFPKPYELRPKDDKPATNVSADEKFMAAMRDNARYWLSRLKEDGEEQCRKEGLGARAIEQLWDWDRRIQAGTAKG